MPWIRRWFAGSRHPRCTAVFLAVCLLSPTWLTAMDLTINGLDLSLDDETGGITRIASAATGELLLAPGNEASLLSMAFPLPEFAALRLASRHSRAEIRETDDGVTIAWPTLGASRDTFPLPEGAVRAEATLRAAADGRSLIISCQITNDSTLDARNVIFPDLRGFLPFDGIEKTHLRLPLETIKPFSGPIQDPEKSAFYTGRGWHDYPPRGLYGSNSLRWLDFGSLRGGISVFQRKWGTDDMPTIRTQRTEAEPDRLRILWEHAVRIQPGESWQSGEFWLTPHAGGWAKGIEPFREYVRQVNPAVEAPSQVRDDIGFQTIWMIQTVEKDPARAAFRFEDLVDVAREARDHGLHELCLWGFCNYSAMPITVRSELGTREEFLSAIAAARELGVNIAPFISIQVIHNDHVERYGVAPGRDDWTYHLELIPNFRPGYTDFWNGSIVPSSNEIWQSDVKAALGDWIEAGLCSFSWDVLETEYVDGKPSPLLDLIDGIRQTARAKNPQSTFSAESVSPGSLEQMDRIVDYTWNWVDYTEAGPILNVLPGLRVNCNVERSPLVVKKGFCDGLYLNVFPRKLDAPNGTARISEWPELSAALKEVAPLRRQWLPYYTDGVFIGECVLSEPAEVHVAGHVLGDKMLVAVLNDSDTERSYSLSGVPWLWLPADMAYNVRLTDSAGSVLEETVVEPGANWRTTERTMAPLELNFYEWQPAQ